MKRHFYLYLILLGLFPSCLTEDDLNIRFDGITPVENQDGHVITHPDSVRMDATMLEDIFKDAGTDENLWPLRSLLVFRNGKLIAERYYKDKSDLNTQHLLWSCTKQFMGILVGIAVDQGIIQSIDDPISMYLESEVKDHPDKKDITIGQLLRMESGIAFSNDGLKGQTDKLLRQKPDDCIEYILNLPMRSDYAESKFNYNDGDPLLLSAILQNASGMHTDEWADQVLFAKIGLKNYTWRRYKDGRTFGGFGIEATPRELGRIALLVSDSGKWGSEQVVSSNWIAQMTSVQTDTKWDYDFGLQWWIDRERNIPFMWGHGGQFAFILNAQDLVIVATSIPNTQGDYQIRADEILPYVDRIAGCVY